MPEKVQYTGTAPCWIALGVADYVEWQPGQTRAVSDEDRRHLLDLPNFVAVVDEEVTPDGQ